MASDKLMLNNIQMLRAIAAIAVVLHHAYPHYIAMGGHVDAIANVSQWGFIGVDIFFIISGFIMAYTTFNKERTFESAKTFFKHRLFRIYLGYWPFFFLMLLDMYMTNREKLLTLDIVGSALLINTDMFELVLPVSWSLSYELYFYFLFLFTFLFSARQLYIAIPLLVASILFLVLYTFFKAPLAENFFYSPFLLEFFAGVALYMYREMMMKTWLLPLSLFAMTLAYYYGISGELRNGLLRILSFGSGAFFVVLIALILEEKNFFRAGEYFTRIGNASYTLYLAHLLILQWFYYLGLRSLFSSEGPILPLLGLLVIIILSILFSLIYYNRVEKPLYQWAIGKRRKS